MSRAICMRKGIALPDSSALAVRVDDGGEGSQMIRGEGQP